MVCLSRAMTKDPWDGIACDWHTPPEAHARENAAQLAGATRAAGFPPESAATGKWLSACLFWDGGRTEVETFADRYELYILPRSPEDGTFDVTDYPTEDPETLTTLVEKIRQARSSLTR